jgi:serine/threonine-protein kinase
LSDGVRNRRCPRCQRTYSAPARFCVNDGSPLVEVDVPAAPSPRPVAAVPPDVVRPVAPAVQAVAHAATGAAAAPTPATLTDRILDNRYHVSRRLGEGGMSYVYQAEELDSKRTVAIKVLIPRLARDPASVERLRREATIAMRLSHANVCPILNFGQTGDGLVYLVMPYLAGEPLNEHENRRGPYPVEEGINLLVQMCRGLQHAHELGVVHRDLKPENVMLVPDAAVAGGFRAVVMDFGLAKAREAGAELRKLTQTGIVLGTPEFMSPEQIRGKPLDGRSDVYGLAVLAFELFTAELPFTGKNSQETMLARLRSDAKPIRAVRPDLPARLETVITRALAVQPADRYASMSEFADALRAAAGIGMLGRLFGRS